jgi:HD superfamily phosphodiesterase
MRNLIQQYAKDLTAGRLASGYEHSYRIYQLAKKIGEGMEVDDEVLHAACFLHDIEMSSVHPKSSAEKARAILGETGFAPGKIETVYRAILYHMPGEEDEMSSEEPSIEGKLLHDANLLETLGAIGLIRLSIGSFLWHHLKTMGEVIELLKRWRGYAETFFFPKAKRLAQRRVEFLDKAISRFEEELAL